jgi:hypothetical protein
MFPDIPSAAPPESIAVLEPASGADAPAAAPGAAAVDDEAPPELALPIPGAVSVAPRSATARVAPPATAVFPERPSNRPPSRLDLIRGGIRGGE